MAQNHEHGEATGMAAFTRDYGQYQEARRRWGDEVPAVIMQEAYGDKFTIEQVKCCFEVVKYHIDNGINASSGFRFAGSMGRGSSMALTVASAGQAVVD